MRGGKEHDIHGRIYKFIIRVLKLVKILPKTPENIIIIGQITRSVTSMGANDREADCAITINDFIYKYCIVRKEGGETDFWLNIIADTNSNLKPRMQGLIKEGQEILKIVSTIIYNAQAKMNSKKVK